MTHARFRFGPILCLAALLCGVSTAAYAQAGSALTSLSGTVVDASGGVIPGADVTAKHNGTGATSSAVTGSNGAFNIPALNPGSYTVTVSLMGFKTWVANDVALAAAIPGTVRVALQVGELSETVIVEGGAEIVQTASTAVATTVNVKQISTLPLGSRSALDFISLLPGVDAATTLRAGNVMGLPQAAVNITLDGMNIQDNVNKSNEIFTRVSPRIDAVEEVTFTAAAQGADSAGQGAVQMRFTTRAGTNRYQGSFYYYYQSDTFNTNTWYNKRDGLAKPAITLHQGGGRVGGPIVIPGLYDGHDKAFFFFNYEELYQPTTIKDDRTILAPSAVGGLFSYGTNTVDVLALAARNGQLATVDPTVVKLLNAINGTTGQGALKALANPNLRTFTWQQPGKGRNRYPTLRLDYNLTNAHRLSFSWNWQHIYTSPDTTNSRQARFPGFAIYGIQDSIRYTWQTNARSTFGKNIVNEFRIGSTGGPTEFNPNWSNSMFADTNGYHLNINGTMALSNAGSIGTGSKQSREGATWVVEDALNWQKGAHSLAMGASFTRVNYWVTNSTPAPTVNFGVVSGDTAQSMFTTANFPGASSTDLTNAQNLYAMLTGRISSIAREGRIDPVTNKYIVMGESRAQARMHDIGFYAQDSWKVRRNLTVNYGLRYEVQLPFQALNASYSNATVADLWGVTGVAPDYIPGALVTNIGYLYQPGVLKGGTPYYREMTAGTKAYETDLNNWAPNVGASWTPYVEDGFLRKVIGEQGDTVVRGGFSTAFQRNGLSDFNNVLNANVGLTIDATRSLGNNNLGAIPLLFRDSAAIGAPAIPETRAYPMAPLVQTGSINLFDPNLQTPFARTWTVGYQRALTRNSAIEVRYVGTHNYQGWTTYNYNDYNIIENGLLNEFKLAQANLQANVAAGRGSNFRYYGPGTGTAPLPIFLAYFNGLPGSQAGDATKYTSSDFSSNTFLSPLNVQNPNPFSIADNLDSTAARRANAIAAGLPSNFLIPNPDMLGGANILGNGGFTTYNGLQVDFRRRLSNGLQLQANYAYGISNGSTRYSYRVDRVPTRQSGAGGGVTHAFKVNGYYELPFGRGKKFLADSGAVMHRIVGNWSIAGSGRVQSGRLLDFGNVRMVGFTEKDLAKMFELRIDGTQKVWMLPDDVIQESVKVYNTSPTSPTGYGTLGVPTGRYFAPANSPTCMETIDNAYGDCGTRTLLVTGPIVMRFDVTFAKIIPIKGRMNIELRAEIYNIFNRVNFTPLTGIGSTTASGYEVTGALDQARTSQLALRFNW